MSVFTCNMIDFMTTRIPFVIGKGGVGKTTCSMLVAAALHHAGQSISLDDRDPQQAHPQSPPATRCAEMV